MIELYINDKRVDLGDSESVLTLGINNIGEIASRQGTYSNEFTLPPTANNEAIFGYWRSENSLSLTPYQVGIFNIRYYGNACIRGVVNLVSADHDGYTIRCFSDNAEWSSKLQDLSIVEVNPTTTVVCERYPWSVTSCRDDNWQRGFIWPNANFGQIDNSMPVDQKINVTWQYPIWYLKFILKEVFDFIGYTPTGAAWNDPVLETIVLSASGKTALSNHYEYDTEYRANTSTSTWFPIPATTPPATIYHTVTIDTESSDPSGSFNTSTYQYTAAFPMTLLIDLNVEIDPVQYAALSLIISFAAIYVNGVSVDSLYLGKVTTPYQPNTRSGQFELVLNAGDVVDIRAGYSSGTGIPLNIKVGCDFIPQNIYHDGQPITIGGAFKDWKATDFIALWFNLLGVNYMTNNFDKTINFFYSKSVLNNKPKAFDLTSFIDFKKTPNITPYFQNFGQKNRFAYALDSADEGLLTYNGEGFIQCGNANLEAVKDVYESKCALFIRRTFLSGSADLAVIPYDIGSGDIKEKVGVLFNDGNRVIFDDLSPGGNNPATQYGMRCDLIEFTKLIPQYYTTISNVLLQPKTVTYLTKLNFTQLRDFDWTKPVYIEGRGYFYVNEISDVTLDESTKPILTLTRLN